MKTIKLTLAALALTAVPSFALAFCNYGEQTVMSCAEGSTYDAETGTCVPVTTS